MLGKPVVECSAKILFCCKHFESCMFTSPVSLLADAIPTLFEEPSRPSNDEKSDEPSDVEKSEHSVDVTPTKRPVDTEGAPMNERKRTKREHDIKEAERAIGKNVEGGELSDVCEVDVKMESIDLPNEEQGQDTIFETPLLTSNDEKSEQSVNPLEQPKDQPIKMDGAQRASKIAKVGEFIL